MSSKSPAAPLALPAPSPYSVSFAGVQIVGHREADRIGAEAVVRRHDQLAREQVDDEAAVAVDVVDAAPADDHVVAGAAGEMVAGLAAADHVRAGAAVRRDADRRERAAGLGGEQPRRVDHVVAEVGELRREREEEVRRAGAQRRAVRLGPEVADRHLARVARVPAPVLRRVAVDDQGRGRSGASEDRDVVSADQDPVGARRVGGRDRAREAGGGRDARPRREQQDVALTGGGRPEAGDHSDRDAVEQDGLPRREPGGRPRSVVDARDRRAGSHVEDALHADEGVAATVDRDDAAVC